MSPLLEIGVVVVTHGQLATELLNSAEAVVGDLPHFTAVSIVAEALGNLRDEPALESSPRAPTQKGISSSVSSTGSRSSVDDS